MAERRVTFSIGQRAVRIVANRDSANKSLLLKVHAPSFPREIHSPNEIFLVGIH